MGTNDRSSGQQLFFFRPRIIQSPRNELFPVSPCPPPPPPYSGPTRDMIMVILDASTHWSCRPISVATTGAPNSIKSRGTCSSFGITRIFYLGGESQHKENIPPIVPGSWDMYELDGTSTAHLSQENGSTHPDVARLYSASLKKTEP